MFVKSLTGVNIIIRVNTTRINRVTISSNNTGVINFNNNIINITGCNIININVIILGVNNINTKTINIINITVIIFLAWGHHLLVGGGTYT